MALENIECLMLENGRELIADVRRLGNGMARLVDACWFRATSRGVEMQPLLILGDQKQKSVDIDLARVLYTYTPRSEMLSEYNKLYGTGLVLPKTTLLG